MLAGFGVFAENMGPAAANAGPAWGCRKSRLVSGILRNVIGAGADTSDSVRGDGAAIGIVRSGIMLWTRLMGGDVMRSARPASMLLSLGSVFWTYCAAGVCFADDLPAVVEFNRDIRPILSDTCYQCHGPDSTQRKAELRLDLQKHLYDVRDNQRLVLPRRPEDSLLWQRVTSRDPDERMPPADSDRRLKPRDLALIRKWIAQGAVWQPHWSFVPPRAVRVPRAAAPLRIRNPIDAFVLQRLTASGLGPSPVASRHTLIRRVTLDLTGLPPTPEEVDRFLADPAPNAYEKVVDRLLRSPRYGEKMAVHWLDAARYADTSGYQNDGPRSMWRWRDWVIEAFNANMSFDQFTIEQIAGDMLPGATMSQSLATGFNRNHRGNAEGGIVPEEFAVEYVIDRVETTAGVWLGLTMGCARCHEHKFDPISQREFYQFYSYFNNVPESGRAIKEGNSPPFIKVPTNAQQQRLNVLRGDLLRSQQAYADRQDALQRSLQQWESAAGVDAETDWTVDDGLTVYLPGDHRVEHGPPVEASADADRQTTAGAAPKNQTPADVDPLVTDIHWAGGKVDCVPGKLGDAYEFTGQQHLELGDAAHFGYFDQFSISLWVRPTASRQGTLVSRMEPIDRGAGYNVHLRDGHIQLNLVKRWLDDSLRVETVDRLLPDRWQHVLVTYDGSRVAAGIRIYLNGSAQRLHVNLDAINQTFTSDEPLRLATGNSRFSGRIDELRIYDRTLSADEALLIATPQNIAKILAIRQPRRTAGQRHKLREFFEHTHAGDDVARLRSRIIAQHRALAAYDESVPTAMVMRERKTPRQTHILIRGQYDQPGEPVASGLPDVLPGLPVGAPNNRLGLARWLVMPGNPLTARVIVNRVWQMYFGVGIVETAEDFGSQGTPPSHPQLLDWLAVELMRTGWDLKALHKLIVMSGTYRQSSATNPSLVERDPDNRLLARGPRIRLSAEEIRDQALAVAGLLIEQLGGPSVRPYQPEGLWQEIASDKEYNQSTGRGLYRRSVYTYWKRTVAPPVMMNFDAAGRETCTVRRSTTNTPLQALTLLNDVTFVEAARGLAQRMLAAGGRHPRDRIQKAFALAIGRPARPAELQILLAGYQNYLRAFRAAPDNAQRLIRFGASLPDQRLNPAELAACISVASLILNLDEAVTKE